MITRRQALQAGVTRTTLLGAACTSCLGQEKATPHNTVEAATQLYRKLDHEDVQRVYTKAKVAKRLGVTRLALLYPDSTIDLRRFEDGLPSGTHEAQESDSDIFPVASVTKTVTALLIADAAQNGLLSLETPVGDILPDVHKSIISANVTVRDLLIHRSGYNKDPEIRQNIPFDSFDDFDPTIRDPLSATRIKFDIALQTETSSPHHRQHRHYSNMGYDVLGRIIERVHDRTLAEVIELKISDPLGLQSFGASPSDETLSRVPQGLMRNNHTKELRPVPSWLPAETVGSVGLYTSAHDLARYVRAHFITTQSSVFAPDTVRMLAFEGERFIHKSAGAFKQGLGWWIDDFAGLGPVLRHNGDADGHSAFCAWSPHRKIGVVSLSSGDYTANYGLGNEMLLAMLDSNS